MFPSANDISVMILAYGTSETVFSVLSLNFGLELERDCYMGVTRLPLGAFKWVLSGGPLVAWQAE